MFMRKPLQHEILITLYTRIVVLPIGHRRMCWRLNCVENTEFEIIFAGKMHRSVMLTRGEHYTLQYCIQIAPKLTS